jgi:hypothetical protein
MFIKVLIYTMVRILEKAGQLESASLVKQHSLRSISMDNKEDPVTPNFNELIREVYTCVYVYVCAFM